jgi:hypothetical protein
VAVLIDEALSPAKVKRQRAEEAVGTKLGSFLHGWEECRAIDTGRNSGKKQTPSMMLAKCHLQSNKQSEQFSSWWRQLAPEERDCP